MENEQNTNEADTIGGVRIDAGVRRMTNLCRDCRCALCEPYEICEDCEKKEVLDALKTAWEAMCERRDYADSWEWKYRLVWDEEDMKVKRAIKMLGSA